VNLDSNLECTVSRTKSSCLWFAHGVDRVIGFFSSRPELGQPPPPHPQANTSPPLWFRGTGTLSCGRGWGGVPIRTRRQTLWYSRYICTLWVRVSDHKYTKVYHSPLMTDWVSLTWYFTEPRINTLSKVIILRLEIYITIAI
jgi:hypothetical protein